jgi:ferredoxin
MAKEVEVRFGRENVEGIVPVGTYLIDAAKRLGVRFDGECIAAADIHYCSIMVESGMPLMSDETQAETDHFQKAGRKKNERLACQVKIERPGEVVIMTHEKAKDATAEPQTVEDAKEQYKKEFTEMPLEKKIASLVELETIAFGETVSFIINSPFKVADKLMDVMAEFGFKKEEQQKNAVRPTEHTGASTEATTVSEDRSADNGTDGNHSKDPAESQKTATSNRSE